MDCSTDMAERFSSRERNYSFLRPPGHSLNPMSLNNICQHLGMSFSLLLNAPSAYYGWEKRYYLSGLSCFLFVVSVLIDCTQALKRIAVHQINAIDSVPLSCQEMHLVLLPLNGRLYPNFDDKQVHVLVSLSQNIHLSAPLSWWFSSCK